MRAPRILAFTFSAVIPVLACGGGSPASPSATSPFAPDALPPLPPRPLSPLPLGEAVGGGAPCPSGSPPGPTCASVTVACPDVPTSPVLLRIDRPVATTRGTILLTTDGDGLMFARSNAVSPLAASMIARFVADGLTVVEVAWRPGMWGGPRARTLACIRDAGPLGLRERAPRRLVRGAGDRRRRVPGRVWARALWTEASDFTDVFQARDRLVTGGA